MNPSFAFCGLVVAVLLGAAVDGRWTEMADDESHPAEAFEAKYKRDISLFVDNKAKAAADPKCKTAVCAVEDNGATCEKNQKKVNVIEPPTNGAKIGCNHLYCQTTQCIYVDCAKKKPEDGYSRTIDAKCKDSCKERKAEMDCGCKFYKCEAKDCTKKFEAEKKKLKCACDKEVGTIAVDKCGCAVPKCVPKKLPPSVKVCKKSTDCTKCQTCEETAGLYGKGCLVKTKTCKPKTCKKVTCKDCEIHKEDECCKKGEGTTNTCAPPPMPPTTPCKVPCFKKVCRPHDDTPKCKDNTKFVCKCEKNPPPIKTCKKCDVVQASEDSCGFPKITCNPPPTTPLPPKPCKKCEVVHKVHDALFPASCTTRVIQTCVPRPPPTALTCTDCEKKVLAGKDECGHEIHKCEAICSATCNKTACDHQKGKCILTNLPPADKQHCVGPKKECHICTLCPEDACPEVLAPTKPACKDPCTGRLERVQMEQCPHKQCSHKYRKVHTWSECKTSGYLCPAKPKCNDRCEDLVKKVGGCKCGCDCFECVPKTCVGCDKTGKCDKCHELEKVLPSETGCPAPITKCVPRCPNKGKCGPCEKKVLFNGKPVLDDCGCQKCTQGVCEATVKIPGFTCHTTFPNHPCPAHGIDHCGCPKNALCEECPPKNEEEICSKCHEEKITTKCAGSCTTKECVPKPCPKEASISCKLCEIKVEELTECGCRKEVCKPQPCAPLPACKAGERHVIRKSEEQCCPCFMGCESYVGPTLAPGVTVPAKYTFPPWVPRTPGPSGTLPPRMTLPPTWVGTLAPGVTPPPGYVPPPKVVGVCQKDEKCEKPTTIETCEECVAK